MTTNQKINKIKEAIAKADNFQSKLTDEVRGVPFLGSLKIRALLNNIGELGEHFLEVGSHKGGSFCSTVFKNDNLKIITAIDSWESDHMSGDEAYPVFIANAEKFKPADAVLHTIVSDCFNLPLESAALSLTKYDIYGYDAGHSFEDQRQALIYYKDILADEFIYLCDDWTYGDVKEGTLAGIKEGGFEVLFEAELLNTTQGEDLHLNDEWWRGYFCALLRKKI